VKVAAGPRQHGCRPRRRTTDMCVAVLGARQQARPAARSHFPGRVHVSRTPARPGLVGRRAVGAAGRHGQHRGPVQEVVGASQSWNLASTHDITPAIS